MRKLSVAILFFVSLSCHSNTKIVMKEVNGVYSIPCKVNGVKLDLIFDTGAAYVQISASEAKYMLDKGYLKSSDMIGSEKTRIANGEIAENIKIRINELYVGSFVLHSIDAIVVNRSNAPLLFGLSAIQKLGKILIENNDLTILDSKADDISYNKDDSAVKVAIK